MYVKDNEIGVARHYSTWRSHFEFMEITLIFHAFFDVVEKKISDGSTTKVILYVKKRLHAKIGACILPVTINTLSDLTSYNIRLPSTKHQHTSYDQRLPGTIHQHWSTIQYCSGYDIRLRSTIIQCSGYNTTSPCTT